MGCTASKFEREKSATSRCRNRELLIKQCVQKQHAYAAAHAAYIRSLRDTGAALRQFGEGGDAKPDTGHGMDFSLDMVADDSRQLSHTFASHTLLADHKTPAFPLEEEPGLGVDENANVNVDEALETPSKSAKTSELVHLPTESGGAFSAQRPDAQISVVDFARRLKELDDNFLQAYESGRDVARLLEGQRTHYYSSFDSYKDSCDHSSRVLRVMSWARHTQLASITDEATDKTLNGHEKETHAATLDKLLAWEKKLYDEVKVGEVIRIKLERKSVQLKKQKKREESSLTLNKTKAVVKDLQTRYLVEVQAVDAASSEVQKLRDDLLHSQLVDLVQKSTTMWQAMVNCHQQQYQVIEDMRLVDTACAPTFTNDSHTKNTLQLESEIHNWHHNLENLIATQKDYMNSVHMWLRLHITEIESGRKGVPTSPEKLSTPPVYTLCKSWLSALDQVHGNVPLNALKAFSGVIQELKTQQVAELKQKKKLDQLKKELERKEQAFRSQELKYKKFHEAHGGSGGDEELASETEMDRSPLKEKEVSLRLLRERVESEHEKYEQMCAKSGNMVLSSLQSGLPPVLSAMRDFARTCSQTYTELFILTMAEETPVLQISF
ncbi:hypothetical protein GOP47_0018981 [Adiantum capillus-veneris]|uniref:Nitrate regulatory gene2 protein n=1 Tax=Adiantum capillus-veneris TaxID=13818 RepID=A0A9D4UET8_ADICA|nr:hypothetical protein GOP47_0018981 [Adiantum capillus-veneris]